jgi:hypothetical protein
MKKRYYTWLTLVLLLIPGLCLSAEFQGKIVKSKGSVLIRNNKGEERTPEVSDYIAVTDEAINTRSGGKAVVKFTNGSVTVIGENSSLGIEKPTLFRQLRGRILFAFTKYNGPTRMVQTDSAVFAVRATYFLVDKSETRETLALKEGLISVESPDKPFEIHRKATLDELAAFKADMEKGADDLKKEGDAFIRNEKKEFVTFKKSFLVNPDEMIVLSGNRVNQGTLGDDEKASIDDLEAFGGDLLKDSRK